MFLKSARQSDYVRNVFQAWVVMFTQHLSYGDWMSPVYLVLCALVFCAAYNASFFSHIAFTSTVISNFSFKNTPKEKFEAKLEQLKNKEVKALLFDSYIRDTNNAKEGNKSINSFFTSSKNN